VSTTTADIANAPKESEARRHQNVPGATPQPTLAEPDAGLLSRVLSGAPGEPAADGAGQIFRSAPFSHPVNHPRRASVIQRAQRTHGNHFAQSLITGTNRQPAGAALVQRCAAGKICEECQSAADMDLPPEPSLVPSTYIQRAPSSPCGGEGVNQCPEVIPSSSMGEPLPEGTRGFMESRFGEDFSGVRVHADAPAGTSAQGLNADAYTSGRDIYFAPGRYAPARPEGQRLLAHELAHTIQQGNGTAAQEIAAKSHGGVVVGEADHPLEAEADRAAAAALDHGPAPAGSLSTDRSLKIRRGFWGTVWDYTGGQVVSAAEWAGGKAWEGAQAVGRGAKWLGKKAWQGGKWLYGKGKKYISAAWECAKKTGSALFAPIDITAMLEPPAPDISSVSELVGKPAPTEDNPDTLNTIMEVLDHPCLKMVPVLSEVTSLMAGTGKFLAGAWEMVTHPEKIWEALKAAVSGFIGKIPDAARALVEQAMSASASLKAHLVGVLKHLEPKLEYLAANWWEVIKQTAWELIWPWPSVWEDLKKTWTEIKSGANELWDLNFSKAADHFLAAVQQVNSILGLLYGWFAIASILIGAIIGAFFGGAGAIPGAMAGAAFAFEVGEGLLIATVAVETAVISKSVFNLVATKETPAENEEEYEKIAGSGLTLGITGVMFLLGAIAARFAKGLLSRAANLFRKPPEVQVPKIEAPKVEGPKVEPPKVEGPKAEPGKVEPAKTEPPKAEPPKKAAEAARAEDLPKIKEKAADPENIREVSDPDFVDKYDAEIDVDGHTYRRSKSDGTWCRFGSTICKIELPEVKGKVDEALAKKQISPAEKAKMKAEAEAEAKQAIKEAKKLIGKNKKFKDAKLEEAYQNYVARKEAAGLKPRNRAEWKVARDFFWGEESPFTRGRNFNDTAGSKYPYNEVHLENGKRLDSYRRSLKDPSQGEIVSRKAVDFDAIDESTFRRFLQEFKDKYTPGKVKIRSDKYPGIDGETLQGRKILEVPATNQGLPEAKIFESIAKSEGVEIRYRPE
jgi:hypothetical protein